MTEMTVEQAMTLAVQHHQGGRLAEAEAIYRRVLSAQPDHSDALHLLGIVAAQANRPDVAVAYFTRATTIAPRRADYLGSLGNALQTLGRLDEAVLTYQRAIAIDSTSAEIYNNLGCALRENSQFDEAIESFNRALSLKPDYSEAHNNLGNALRDVGRLDESIKHIERALSLRPGDSPTYNNLGASNEQAGRYDTAIDMYRRSISHGLDYARAHVNLGIALLRNGDYSQGLREYEWRLNEPGLPASQQQLVAAPRWTGEPLAARRILLHAEQGLGDTIQFVRYIPLVAARGGRVVLRCQSELQQLCAGMEGIEHVISSTDSVPNFDVQCALPSLPLVFETSVATIPAQIPYLRPDPARAARWKSRLLEDGRIKIGLAWAGRKAHRDDRNRSLPEGALAPLTPISNVQFVSLQVSPGPQQQLPMTDWSAELQNFSDTAALIDNLDLIIAVDTSVAHLAGAMGKPTWLLLPFVPDWRWMLDRTDSPWYPTMRLFRQPDRGDWARVIQQVEAELRNSARRRTS